MWHVGRMSQAKGTADPSPFDWSADLPTPRSRPSHTATIGSGRAARKVEVVPVELRDAMDATLADMRGLGDKAKALGDDIEAERAKLREFAKNIPN
jgi:hypothetical protein